MYLSKDEIDVLPIILGYLPDLRRIGSSKWGGACPFCIPGTLSGKDRFSVKPELKLWNCNQCSGGRWHDIITFIQLVEGLNYIDACEFLDLVPNKEEKRDEGSYKKTHVPSPAIEWSVAAWKFIRECEQRLHDGSSTSDGALKWLMDKRGLTEESILRFRLGFNPQELELDILGEPYKVDRGIVIPNTAVDETLWGVKVATGNPKSKYGQLKGSRNALVGSLKGSRVLLVVEGEFDRLLAEQEVGDLVDVVTLGSCSNAIPTKWMKYVIRYPHIVVLYDNDDAGHDGAVKNWSFLNGRLMYPFPVLPKGNDITEFVVEHKLSLRDWLEGIVLKAFPKVEKEYEPEELIAAEEPTYLELAILQNEVMNVLRNALNPITYKELVAKFGNTSELEEAFRRIKEEGYIVDYGKRYMFQPLRKEHDPYVLHIAPVPERPYWVCPCGKASWRYVAPEWVCTECNQPAIVLADWEVSQAYLKAKRRPVFGQPVVRVK